MTEKWVRIGAWAGFAAQVVFVVSWLLAAAWQGDGYRVLAHTISDMYAVGAPGGWFLVVVLTLCGLGTVLFALLGLRPALRGSGAFGLVGSVLLALSILGLGDLLTPFEREACRAADPGCTPADQLANLGGKLDGLLSTAGLVLLVVSGFLLAAAMARLPAWRSAVRRTRTWILAVLVLLLATAFVPGAGGLTERLLAAGASAWVAWLAWAVLRRQDSGEPVSRS
jgi:hypothetical protein